MKKLNYCLIIILISLYNHLESQDLKCENLRLSNGNKSIALASQNYKEVYFKSLTDSIELIISTKKDLLYDASDQSILIKPIGMTSRGFGGNTNYVNTCKQYKEGSDLSLKMPISNIESNTETKSFGQSVKPFRNWHLYRHLS